LHRQGLRHNWHREARARQAFRWERGRPGSMRAVLKLAELSNMPALKVRTLGSNMSASRTELVSPMVSNLPALRMGTVSLVGSQANSEATRNWANHTMPAERSGWAAAKHMFRMVGSASLSAE